MIINYIIIAVTVATSIAALSNRELNAKLQFNAYLIQHRREWYRFLSYGLIHADWVHLFINMFVFYSFGRIVITYYDHFFGLQGWLYYVLLYVGGLAFSVIADFGKHKENIYYNAVGASGAVSAVVFASIIFQPMGKIYLFFIPIGIPAFIFGILYLIFSAYMAKRSSDNIGHDAHFWGAVYGLIFTLALDFDLLSRFFDQITSGF
ncbi:MAG TPA: rhomboid family intramembrane serine protease [Bacteroidales bacterium]|nr:rhomboid family intramembrane serine protease [Bacteroidales bacterium]